MKIDDDFFELAQKKAISDCDDVDEIGYIKFFAKELQKDIGSDLIAVFKSRLDVEYCYNLEYLQVNNAPYEDIQELLHDRDYVFSPPEDEFRKMKQQNTKKYRSFLDFTPDVLSNFFKSKAAHIANNPNDINLQGTLIKKWISKTELTLKNLMYTPLIAHNGEIVGGILFINKKDDFNINDERYSAIRAFVLANKYLSQSKRFKEQERYQRVIQTRDKYESAGHVKRMGKVARFLFMELAKINNLDYVEANTKGRLFEYAVALHDIGKIGIPDDILSNTKGLTKEEFEKIKLHPAIGAWIYEDVSDDYAFMVKNIALHHHQKWNGHGYPAVSINGEYRPLKGVEIPLEARITAVVDAMDALFTARVYQKKYSKDETMAILKNERDKHFDAQIVDIVLENQNYIIATIETYEDDEKDIQNEKFTSLKLEKEILTMRKKVKTK